MTRRRVAFAIATLANALFTIAPQLLAMVLLEPTDFGAFSLAYLVYALFSTLMYSVVAEPWARSATSRPEPTSKRDYTAVLFGLALLGSVVVLLVSLPMSRLQGSSLWIMGAVSFGVVRQGARYFDLRFSYVRRVLAGDVAGIAGLSIGALLFAAGIVEGIYGVALMWAFGSLAAAFSSFVWPANPMRASKEWIARYRDDIRVLVKDSLLMNVGAIGSPYAIAPILGLADFGVYRGVSNAGAPVRLVVQPLRPFLASRSFRVLLSRRSFAILGGVSIALAVAVSLSLLVVTRLDWSLGTLSDVANFATACGVYVFGNLHGQYLTIVARLHLSGGDLMLGRVVQTLVVTALPVGGAVVRGLDGAIWGFAVSTVLAALTWFVLLRRVSNQID